MKLATDTLTVYNRFTNAQKTKTYTPTVISGIHWFGTNEVLVTNEGLKSAKKYTIRIPIEANFSGKTFVPPKEFERLADKSKHFTFVEGDIIAHGNCVLANPTPASVQEAFEEVVTVVSVTDNRSAPNAPHWRVVCK